MHARAHTQVQRVIELLSQQLVKPVNKMICISEQISGGKILTFRANSSQELTKKYNCQIVSNCHSYGMLNKINQLI